MLRTNSAIRKLCAVGLSSYLSPYVIPDMATEAVGYSCCPGMGRGGMSCLNREGRAIRSDGRLVRWLTGPCRGQHEATQVRAREKIDSRARQREQAGALVRGHGHVMAEFFDGGKSQTWWRGGGTRRLPPWSKWKATQTGIQVRTAMAAQAREQGRYLYGGRPPYR
jgi:hypothetical protein